MTRQTRFKEAVRHSHKWLDNEKEKNLRNKFLLGGKTNIQVNLGPRFAFPIEIVAEKNNFEILFSPALILEKVGMSKKLFTFSRWDAERKESHNVCKFMDGKQCRGASVIREKFLGTFLISSFPVNS